VSVLPFPYRPYRQAAARLECRAAYGACGRAARPNLERRVGGQAGGASPRKGSANRPLHEPLPTRPTCTKGETMLTRLMGECATLTRRSTRHHDRAVFHLGNAFYDVPLSTPMVLGKREARQVTKVAAAEMREHFAAALASDMTPDGFTELARNTDPLWREIAAANWHIAGRLNDQRIAIATQIVTQVLLSQGGNVEETALEMAVQLTDAQSPLMSGPLRLIMTQAMIAPHHMSAALARVAR